MYKRDRDNPNFIILVFFWLFRTLFSLLSPKYDVQQREQQRKVGRQNGSCANCLWRDVTIYDDAIGYLRILILTAPVPDEFSKNKGDQLFVEKIVSEVSGNWFLVRPFSPSHFRIIGWILPWKVLKKSFFQFVKNDPKINKDHL